MSIAYHRALPANIALALGALIFKFAHGWWCLAGVLILTLVAGWIVEEVAQVEEDVTSCKTSQ